MATHLLAAHAANPRSTSRGQLRKRKDDTPTDPMIAVYDMFRDAVREVTDAFRKATSEMQAAVNELRCKLSGIAATQHTFVARMDEVKERFALVGKQASTNAKHIAQLLESEADLRTGLKNATRKLNHIEQMSVDCDVLVSNVEQRENEDPNRIITDLSTLLDVPTTTPKIQSCYRLRSANSNRISPIVVRFRDRRAKEAFVTAAQKRRVFNDQLGGTNTRRVFVNHRMTNAYQEIDKVIRERGARHGYKSRYTNGSFFLRHGREHTAIEVQTTDDLPLEFTAE